MAYITVHLVSGLSLYHLGGNRKGNAHTQLNKCLVFFCTGLWHGAFIIMEGLLPPPRKLRRIFWRPLTSLVVLLRFVLFRAEAIAQAGNIFINMTAGFHFTLEGAGLLRAMRAPMDLLAMTAGCVFSLPLPPRVKALTEGENVGAAVLHVGS